MAVILPVTFNFSLFVGSNLSVTTFKRHRARLLYFAFQPSTPERNANIKLSEPGTESEFIRPPPLRPSCAHADSTLRSSGRSRSPNTVLPRNILHKPDKGDGGSRRKGRSPSVPEPTYPLAVLLPPNSVRSEQNVCGPPVCIPVSSAGSCRRAHRQPQVQVAGRSCGHHGRIGAQ